MSEIDLGPLAHGPHAELISAMGQLCASDSTIRAAWVGGSLAAGSGDSYSDIDFRIAVEPGDVARWVAPSWDRYLPIRPSGGQLLRFGEQALLHHMVLEDGTILDFYVQDTAAANPEPRVVVLACRDDELREKLESFAQPAAPLVREIDGDVCRGFLVEYWITTHKQMKALARRYDLSSFAGLFMERMPLLRALYMETVGKDIDGRPSLHMLGALHRDLIGRVTPRHREVLGMPTRTPAETASAIEAVRSEMSRVGRLLAERHEFAYPEELERVVRRFWDEHKALATARDDAG